MPIEQHPIPQDVAGYKFRLIGDMTLKQFIWLAAGIILGLIIYGLPLPFFFKYPLAAIAVSLGGGIAFIPVEGRSMDKWLIAFIKSVYSPTQYVWQAGDGATQPAVTTEKTSPIVAPPPPPVPPQSSVVSQPVVVVTPPTPPSPPSTQLPIPFTPTTPNTLVGMTLTSEGKILPGCLIEIKSGGLSMRATKSNQLGQFLFAKPLDNGIFQISTEKTDYLFETYSLNLTGQIIKPLRLQAKSTNEQH